MAANVGGRSLRKPMFVKADSLKPGTNGHNLVVKVVSTETTLQKGAAASPHLRGIRVAECLVGDETATILFAARNEQVDLMKPGNTVIIRNAKIDMYKGNMRLAVDKWGRIEVTEPATFVVNEDNNLSLVDYELAKSQSATKPRKIPPAKNQTKQRKGGHPPTRSRQGIERPDNVTEISQERGDETKDAPGPLPRKAAGERARLLLSRHGLDTEEVDRGCSCR
ncbi:Nucleic acid-binding- OB-fold-like protein [Striga hermonthica]|uniref:Nucleic acid-binding- OB-fold-like protein n=1 Tax=Striga hermonthica TaxID=68872 RepID=A0A9N7R2X8_STRHE|nr:Nucleic acid-binding- OB-fold-like protein [Striga hermonthica]